MSVPAFRAVALAGLLLLGCRTAPAPSAPLFAFGVIADVQYADKDTAGKRHYRSSLQRLERAISDLNGRNLAFAVQLGDFIDDGTGSLARVLATWRCLTTVGRHVLGNHDFALPRDRVLGTLGLQRGYYDFARDGWRFVVLDGMDVSVAGGWPQDDPHVRAGRAMLASLQRQRADNAQTWNGGVGSEQLAWLREVLDGADARGEKVVAFCHFPILAAASTPHHLLWNHAALRELIAAHHGVVAWLAGHDHAGGYARDRGVHHLTLHGMVEAAERNAYAVIEVWPDRLEVVGIGDEPTRTLAVR